MNVNRNKGELILTSIMLISSFYAWFCTYSSLCHRMGFDKIQHRGIFGCYYAIARAGGFAGGVYAERDDTGCIVLTPDSLFKIYENDSLVISQKFSVLWQTLTNGHQIAKFDFRNGYEPIPRRLGVSWEKKLVGGTSGSHDG